MNRKTTMTVATGSSKLYSSPDDDIPIAEVLPLKDPRSDGDGGPKAYKIYQNDDIEAQGPAIASVVKEATVLENLGWDPQTRRIFIRKVYSILAVQLMLTFGVSAFMSLHAPTQMYVLTHGWPITFAMLSSIALIVALMCYKVRVEVEFL